MSKIVIGINQRIPLQILEMALTSHLRGNYNEEYILEQLHLDFDGENRISKAMNIVQKIIRNNPIITEVEQKRENVLVALKRTNDRDLILIALTCSAFPYFYTVMREYARYLKVQDIVNIELIKKTIGAKYGSNRSMENGLYCVIPMLIEAQLIERPKQGIYRKTAEKEYSPLSLKIMETAVEHVGQRGDMSLINVLL